MTIEELGDLVQEELIVKRYPQQDNRWMCRFAHSEAKLSKSDIFARGFYGDGKSPEEAIQDYIEQIRGKILLFRGLDRKERSTFGVPNTLEDWQ